MIGAKGRGGRRLSGDVAGRTCSASRRRHIRLIAERLLRREPGRPVLLQHREHNDTPERTATGRSPSTQGSEPREDRSRSRPGSLAVEGRTASGPPRAPALRDRTREAIERVAPTLRDVAGPPVLLHADFKVSNLYWASDDRLLVLDWEFAYAGSALSDIGQLLRWSPPSGFVSAFAGAYRAGKGVLPAGWERGRRPSMSSTSSASSPTRGKPAPALASPTSRAVSRSPWRCSDLHGRSASDRCAIARPSAKDRRRRN